MHVTEQWLFKRTLENNFVQGQSARQQQFN